MSKCHNCGKEFVGETYLCSKCSKRKSVSAKKSKIAKEKMGKCNKCGSDIIDTRYKLCEKCREYYRSREAKRPKLTKSIVIKVLEKQAKDIGMTSDVIKAFRNAVTIELELMGY